MTVSQYQDTAMRSAESYINSMSPEYQAAVAPYEGAGKGAVEQQLEGLHQKPLADQNPEFARYFMDDSYLKLSIDAETLIHFYCRIPGRFGDNEATLKVPMQQVFSVGDSERERYIAFIHRDEMPVVLDNAGKRLADYQNGEALFHKSFDRVTENFQKRHMESVKQTAEKAQTVVPKAPPVLTR